MKTYKLPDAGEGLTDAEIVQWRVAVGDKVQVNTVLVEIETAKSIVELPSPYAGRITALLVDEGAEVEVGTDIVEIDDGVEAEPSEVAEPSGEAELNEEADDSDDTPTLVGYGAVEQAPRRRRRSSSVATTDVLAKPPVRKYARDLGVDLNTADASGPQGSVTRADVDATLAQVSAGAGERREPIKGVRKATAENLVRSVERRVHVTEWLTIDVTQTMEFVERLKKRREFADVRVSPTLLFAKAICLALGRNPSLNASVDEEREEIVYHRDVHLGIAAATPRGLLVPNIKSANQMTLLELARAINELVGVAREGKLQPASQQGGTFTLTNVGVFGVDTGTPIMHGDESGILCMGAIKRRPWVVGEGADERVEPRWVTTLALAFDHRIIDGAEGSKFLTDVGDLLSDPSTALLY
ncbi:dihydrolipoamide acetyltransferase family protein [uncultured Tessaracoccus sp.]|uniref:dihydrolipoamide acetyltransferase family protein n=1 Tax=uncultured Tessaracoccus sp. TaxID=905023 RepID=UPI002634579E|nr:dihydrolipoamide acetyltransferase family protein [uncultured Tessaracoccus sp.]